MMVGRETLTNCLRGVVVILVGVSLSLIAYAGEEAAQKPPKEKAAAKEAQPEKGKAAAKESPKTEKKATLTIAKGSTSKTFGVELTNSVPVRGVQFTVGGVSITEVRTTARTAGFLAKFNEKTGQVILLSTSDDKIAPGKGSIAEVICEKPGTPQLSEIKIAGSNRESLY